MEVKPETVPIGNVTQFLSGGTPSRSIDEYWNGHIPWISASTLQTTEIKESDQNVTIEAVASGSKMAPVDSTLLLVRGSALHNEIRAGIVQAPVCFNQDVKALVPNKGVFPKFLTYSILGRGNDILKLVSSAGNTAGVLDTKLIQRFEIWLPDFTEQRAIATALSDVDALLDGLDRLIAKKCDLKQAAMQRLLTGKTRLPGFAGEWETKRLGEIADIVMGQSPSSSNYNPRGNGLPLIQGNADIVERKTIKRIFTTQITKRGRKGDILMSVRAPVGEISRALFDVCLGRGVCALRFPNDFLYHYLIFLEPSWAKHSKGSTFDSVNSTDVKAVEISQPPYPKEQIAIAAVLSDMDAEIEALEKRRAKTRDLKQAMMQELLTGRIRLVKPVADLQSEPEVRRQPANIHFKRSVLAAEIVSQLHGETTFGHVKFEKMIFLVEHLCNVETGSTYYRQAAGPYDNRALRSIDSQLKKQKWYEARKTDGRYRYVPLEKAGGHMQYFDRYFSAVREKFDTVITTFRTFDTERCAIVATLYSAWNDLIQQNRRISDDAVLHEVLNKWHKSKRRITRDRWLKALGWMREHGFIPEGDE